MDRKKFSLVSKGLKMLSISLTVLFVGLTTVLFIYNLIWYAILFSCIVTIFCLFATILSFLNKIIVDSNNRQLIICSLKRRKIDLNQLQSIEIDTKNSIDKNRYCFILFNLIDGTIYKTSGYSTVFNFKSFYYTQNLVNDLNSYLNKNLIMEYKISGAGF